MTDQDPVVLVVDDETAVADAYAAIVGERYEVRTAYSGEQALSSFDADVDVVLLDRRMPDLVGDEVLETIRERDSDVRVAIVTAVDPDVDIIEMEFDDYVVKPVTGEELLETVERLFRVVEYERRFREYYRVTRKYVTLSATDRVEIADDPDFEALSERRKRLREQLESTADRFDDDDFEALFRELVDNEG